MSIFTQVIGKAGAGLLPRIVAGIVAAAMVAGGSAGAVSQASSVKTFSVPEAALAETQTSASPDSASSQAAQSQKGPSETEKACAAYLDLLLERREGIERYSWQKGYTGYGALTDALTARPVVLADLTGDGIPELLYEESVNTEYIWSTDLNIVTYDGGALKTLFSDSWNYMGGGGFWYYFFQLRGESTLYAYISTGDEAWSKTYVRFVPDLSGCLEQETVCRLYVHPGPAVNGAYDYVYEYEADGREVDEKAHAQKVSELEANTAAVLSCSEYCGDFAENFVSRNGCPAMTCAEAIDCLRGLAGTAWEKVQGEPDPDLFSQIPSVYVFSSGMGAWSTDISIAEDGSFTGSYHNMDIAMNTDEYDILEAVSEFSGRFSTPRKINDYTYVFELEDLTYDGVMGSEEIGYPYGDDTQVRTLFVPAYGIEGCTTFYLYMKDAPTVEVPDMVKNCLQSRYPDWSPRQSGLIACCLYNEENDNAFFASQSYNNWSPAYREFILIKDFLKYGEPGLGYGELTGQYGVVDFALYDMNGDDIPELIIYNGFNGRDLQRNYIFTFDGQTVCYCGSTFADTYGVSGYPGLFSSVCDSGGYLEDEYRDTYSSVTYLDYSSLSGTELQTERVEVSGERLSSGKTETLFKTTDTELYGAARSTPNYYGTMTFSEIEEQGWDAFLALYRRGSVSLRNEVRTFNVKFDDSRSVDLNWGWDLFDKDASEYDHDLAMAGIILSQAAELSKQEAEARVRTLGFQNEVSYSYSSDFWDWTVVMPAVTFASQKITLGGETRIAALIVVRGSSDAGDWVTDYGSVTDGFFFAADIVRERFKSYYSGLSDYYGMDVTPDNTVLFITGHSLGAAVAGQLAQLLEGTCGRRGAIFDYTFASPNYETFSYDREKYTNVHNIINIPDVVPDVPWGYKRYGHDWFYDDNRKSVAGNHILSTYLDCMLSALPSNMGPGAVNPYSRASVHCPVDITVCSPDGAQMARTKGSEVFYEEGSPVLVMTDGEAKYVVAPGGCEYTVFFTGTDLGTMTYTQEIVNGYTQTSLMKKEYTSVPLAPGILYAASASSDTEQKAELFELDADGRAESRISERGRASGVHFGSELPGWLFVGCAALGALLLVFDVFGTVRFLKRKRG